MLFGNLSSVVSALQPLYAGEDPARGKPWYHQELSWEAARGAGWTAADVDKAEDDDSSAAAGLAWHTDYVDSYLYNPVWWAAGWWDRLKAAALAYEDLIKVHFDDLVSARQIRIMWDRYLGGTVAGLLWAAAHDDVPAARHVVGVSLHALQDFYSHSNWVDEPSRRDRTWFDAALPDLTPIVNVRERLRANPTLGNLDVRVPDPVRARLRDVRVGAADVLESIRGRTRRRRKPTRPSGGGEGGGGAASPVDPRTSMHLYTGAYESVDEHLEASTAYKIHGDFAFDCGLLRELVGEEFMDIACAAFSPFTGTSLCEKWRACQDGTVAHPDTVAGAEPPEGIVYLAPKGIALDSKWLAAVNVHQRDLPDEEPPTGEALFNTAKDLALEHSQQWLEDLAKIMAEEGQADFWQQVMTRPRTGATLLTDLDSSYLAPYQHDTDQFEKPGRRGFTFLSAGEYPPSADASDEGWWLRLDLHTADVSNAGTDADIRATVDGKEFLLDHMAERTGDGGIADSFITQHDDFERDQTDSYMLGPLPRVPSSIQLRNDAPGVGDIVEGLWNDIKAAVESFWETLEDVALSLIGGHADYVGSDKETYTWADLQSLARSGDSASFRMRADGGVEGKFDVTGTLTVSERDDGSLRANVSYQKLICHQESKNDRLVSTSDEPFVLLMANSPAMYDPDGGHIQTSIAGPYDGIDSGDRKTLRHLFVDIPVPRYGGLILAMQVWESDDESGSDRDELEEKFAGTFVDELETRRSEFLPAISGAIAPDWKLGWVDAFAFKRGRRVETSHLIHRRAIDRWVAAEESITLPVPRRRRFRRVTLPRH